MSFTAGDAMLTAAQYCNDYNQRIYTNTKLLPLIKEAVRSLIMSLEQNNSAYIRNKNSSPIAVAIGASVPTPPGDFLSLLDMKERPSGGTSDQWTDVDKVEYITDETSYNEVRYWTEILGVINVNPPLTARETRWFYRGGISIPVDANSVITEDDFRTFINFKTAAMAALVIGENESRAAALDGQAEKELSQLIGLTVKDNQNHAARRKPYRGQTRRARRIF